MRSVRRLLRTHSGCLGFLPRNERRVLELLVGLGPARPHSWSATARRMGISERRTGVLLRRGTHHLRRLGATRGCGTLAVSPAQHARGIGIFAIGGDTAASFMPQGLTADSANTSPTTQLGDLSAQPAVARPVSAVAGVVRSGSLFPIGDQPLHEGGAGLALADWQIIALSVLAALAVASTIFAVDMHRR